MHRMSMIERFPGALIAWIIAFSLCGWTSAASVPDTGQAVEAGHLIGTATQQEQWVHGLALLRSGQLDQASRIIRELKDKGVADPRVSSVSELLSSFELDRTERKQRVQDDYDLYVSWTHEDLKAGRWSQAAQSATLAYRNAWDQEAFRKEAWVLEAAEHASEEAEAFQEEKKWYKAARNYVWLTEIFPGNQAYREGLKNCQDHIRLELTYDPESDWQAQVANIVPDMARDAFGRVATDYLKEADFRSAIIGGLKQVLRLTNEPKLAEVFEGLNDEELVDAFTIPIEVRLEHAEMREECDVQDLIAYFDRVLEINREAENLFPQNVLINEFVYGALKTLDKFSDMIWPAEVLEFNKHTQGRFFGVGIQIRKNAGEPILVVTPLKDSPAYGKGIRPGDLITKINGRDAKKYTISRAVREITGPEGTTVTLTIKRNTEVFDVPLVRKEIIIETIKGLSRTEDGSWEFMVDPQRKIGYVRLTNFTDTSFKQLKEVVEQLDEDGLQGLIFDLRDNPGGPLKASIEVADLFLDQGRRIVSTRDRDNAEWQAPETSKSEFTDFPMILLTSKYSASASEIVTGALQVHNRALVLGERTYGKGSVQQVLPLNHSRMAFLKLTTQHYYLPDGRCLHKEDDSTMWGVDPDVECRLMPKERIKLYDLQLRQDIIKGKGQTNLTDEDIRSVTGYSEKDEDESTQTSGEGMTTSEDATTTAPSSDAAATTDADEEGDEDEDDEEFVKRDDPNEHPDKDPQFEEALLLMRIRLDSRQPWPDQPVDVAATPAMNGGS